MKTFVSWLNALASRHDRMGIDAFPQENSRITGTIEADRHILQDIFGASNDLIFRDFYFAQNSRKATLVSVDGLSSAERLSLDIIKPMMYDSHTAPPSVKPRSMQDIQNAYMTAGETTCVQTFGDVVHGCLAGDAALLVDGIAGALIINAKNYPTRSVEAPQTESVLRGPREGFIESMRINTALLRRKIRDPNLTVETCRIGRKTHTDVSVVYLRNVADDALVKEVKRRLSAIDTDAILDSGYIEQYIFDGGSPFFTTIASSEKPDAVAGKLLEGRVAVIVDGSPYVLTMPALFIETFHTAEDYYIPPVFASALRTVRLIAFFVSLLALPLYVAMTTFHPELIPTELLLSIAAAEGSTPFPAVIEALIMIIVFEILKEAGIRLPRPAGQAVSMVGAIIIGETAVSAGIIGAPMVIAVAITAVSAFATPAQANVSMLLRLVFLFLAGAFGGLGLTLGLMGLLLHLAALSSFGVPYLSPIAPFDLPDNKDSLFRLPLYTMLTRPSRLASRNPRRQRVPKRKERP